MSQLGNQLTRRLASRRSATLKTARADLGRGTCAEFQIPGCNNYKVRNTTLPSCCRWWSGISSAARPNERQWFVVRLASYEYLDSDA